MVFVAKKFAMHVGRYLQILRKFTRLLIILFDFFFTGPSVLKGAYFMYK
jgi:hypothetical protein